MATESYTDWRNRYRSPYAASLKPFIERVENGEFDEDEIPPFMLKKMENFQLFSCPDAHNRGAPYWVNPSFAFGRSHSPVRSRPLTWSYCPSVNHTYLRARDETDYIPSIASHYGSRSPVQRMVLHNGGKYIGKRQIKRVLHQEDNWHRCNAIASQLDLNSAQKARVHFLLDRFNLKEEGIGIDKMTYTLCALICREDGRRTYPSRNSRRDPLFAAFAERMGYSDKRVQSLMQSYGRSLKASLRPKDERRKLSIPPRQPEPWSLAAIDPDKDSALP